ncbi:YicC/YloC family endoribonuclease [Paenibacillus borealis]|uniref:Stress-induced protein n=1 Tax=Paenibacillus borealis TaxID=160799 RepID=A0A089LBJ5_PAEBO|nr:YicC/YloC family endoribonuclease [Paenibacillus borealis]AIQ58202.1 stress-induced protein [Paenibacillus borealis]
MSFSMTGYGQSSLQFGGHKISFEVKSVNNRYCEVVLRMPRDWTGYEDMLRRIVQNHIKRGRVDVIINRELTDGAADGQALNRTMVKAYLDAAEILSREYGFPGELTLRDILSMPGVMELKEETPLAAAAAPSEEVAELLKKGLGLSLEALLEMRAREGGYLAADLSRRLDHLEELHAGISALAPLVVNEYREKLRQRLSGLNDGSFPWDEHKIGMDIAIFADRCNIDEELTRLYSHFGQCRALLLGGEPAGRKLDFLIQEMNRETNTIGSKCNHLNIVNLTLDMKAELEKIREQAANLE